MGKENVLVFRSHLLPYSNTFIKEQIAGYRTYNPYLIGTKRVNELDISAFDTIALTDFKGNGSLKRLLFATTSHAPSFYRKLRDAQPVLIHAHFGTDAMMALKIKDKLQLPLVTTFHGYDICTYPNMSSHYNHKMMFKYFDRLVDQNKYLIAVSDFIKGKLIERGASEEKVIRHYIGVDVEKFPQKLMMKKKQILFVGRLVEKKGCEYLIEAFKEFTKYFPDYQLVIIGSGPLRSKLEALARTISKKILFAGKMSHEEVLKAMTESEMFCAPSVVAENGDAEALGLVFAEAQGCYTPVVSFDTGGISEVVKHGESGFLAKEKDAKSLASFLKDLAGDSKLRATFGQVGKSFIERDHNLKIQTVSLEKLYKKIA